MKKLIVLITFLAVLLLGISSAVAGGPPWTGHATPFDFLFGNQIDQYLQSKLLGNGDIQGFFYITFTGKTNLGYPAADHGEDTVGWVVYGVPVKAKLLALPPMMHPQWCINPADLPREKGFSHFHWLGMPMMADGLKVGQTYGGYLLKLTAIDSFYFTMAGGFIVTPGIDDYSHLNIVTSCP